MEVQEIKTFDDIVLAYKKGQLLRNRLAYTLWNIVGFIRDEEGKNKVHICCLSADAEYFLTPESIIDDYDILISVNTYQKLNKVSTNYIKQNNKEDKMEDFVKRMIVEHKELCERIDKLDAFVHNVDTPKNVHPVEYANLCIQLRGMKMYEDALRARLHNQGVEVDGDNYYATIKVEDEEESAIDND